MIKIVLIVKDQTSSANFHYAMKSGRPLVMPYDRTIGAHVAKFTLEEWRKDNFYLARNLLDQRLPVPILFDIEEVYPEQPEGSLPISQPENPPATKRRIRRLSTVEKQELAADMAH